MVFIGVESSPRREISDICQTAVRSSRHQQHLQPGFTLPFRDHLTMMIIVSDNTCTGTVADMVGLDQVNALCHAVGMNGTTHRQGIPPKGLDRDHPVDAVNATTPADVPCGATITRSLYSSGDWEITHMGFLAP